MIVFPPQEYVVMLAMMIIGFVMGCQAQSSVMSPGVTVTANEKIPDLQLTRRVKHSQIEVDALILPFDCQILQALCNFPLVLVLVGIHVYWKGSFGISVINPASFSANPGEPNKFHYHL